MQKIENNMENTKIDKYVKKLEIENRKQKNGNEKSDKYTKSEYFNFSLEIYFSDKKLFTTKLKNCLGQHIYVTYA